MKQFRNLTIGFLIAAFTMVQVSAAQTGDISGNGGAISCRNGGRDYGNFLSAVISYDGFVEYWRDITGWPPFIGQSRYNSNMCLYLDVDNLLHRIDKTRQQIRNAFYTCNSNASKLARTYYELEAELYFLRKYVDVGNGQVLIANDKKLSNEFIDYFVNQKSFFSVDDAQALLTKFINKYKARESTYENCADPTWGNLIAKWNEFKSSLGGFTAIQESIDSIQKNARAAASGWGDIFSLERLKGLVDAKINGLDPATAWADISKELSIQSPSGFTFNQFNAATYADNQRVNQQIDRATYLGQYQQLYQQSSADIVQEIIARVTSLETTIKGTYDFIDKTATCTKGIVDRTCK